MSTTKVAGKRHIMSEEERMRLLVATGEAVADPEELPPLVRAVLRSASEVLVMTPVLVSGLRWIASDTDRARYEADERLARVLGQMAELVPDATVGAVRGADVPLTAFDDAIRAFRPGHLLIALRGSDHDAWQEQGLLENLLRAHHVPITVFEIDRAGRVPSAIR